jgi:hypothetical protein
MRRILRHPAPCGVMGRIRRPIPSIRDDDHGSRRRDNEYACSRHACGLDSLIELQTCGRPSRSPPAFVRHCAYRMKRSCVRHRHARGVGAVFALLMGLLFSAERVHASCGDYVTLHPSTGPGASSDVPSMPLAQKSAANHRGMPRHDAPMPCSGPQCSRGSIPQPLPAPVVVHLELRVVAVLPGIAIVPAEPPVREWLAKSNRPPSEPAVDPIYHPPR